MSLQQLERPTLNPALRTLWELEARNRVLYGGRASSKSWDAGGRAVQLAGQKRRRFLCARQFQNKIDESVYTLLKVQIRRFGQAQWFNVLRNSIVHRSTGTEFLFYGLWRHIDEIKSLEDIDICWLEEAHNTTAEQWEVLEPTLRKEGSEFWIIFNPRLVTDFAYRKFVTQTSGNPLGGGVTGELGGTIKRKINYTENDWLSDTIKKVIADKKAEDEDDYNHIYGGEPKQDDEAAIIKRSWLMASIDAHKLLGIEPSGRKRVGWDVGDTGDPNASVCNHGTLTTHVAEWKAREDELPKSAARVHLLAMQLGADIAFDSIGIGAFAGAEFQALNEAKNTDVGYHKFVAGGKVLDPKKRIDERDPRSPKNVDYYSDAKAQAWGESANGLRNTFTAVQAHKDGKDWRAATGLTDSELIFISSECDHLDGLIDELSTPRKDYDRAGKLKVESKKQLRDRDIPSHNKADAFVMAHSRARTYVPPSAEVGSWGQGGE